MKTMTVARMHRVGAPLQLDTLPVPEPGATDVLVAIKACNVVPNLRNILVHWPDWHPEMPLPELPGSFGLDASGVIAAVGSQVVDFAPGERVYVNPGTGCGGCLACRSGRITDCRSFTYRGYFGRGPATPKIFKHYPYGGLSEYVTAPQSSLVRLPASVGFEEGARFGYLGTAYAALRKGRVGPAKTVLVNAIGGTLGVNAAMLALAMGATRVLGTGRRMSLLERVKALAPDRIEVLSVEDAGVSIRDWALGHTGGEGVDTVIDALPPKSPPGATMAALRALRTGGRGVLPGGMTDALTLDPNWLIAANAHLMGSRWFSVPEGEDLAAMAAAGTLDLSVLEHRRFPLAQVNEAITAAEDARSGFSNVVVMP
jgi:D-arabinose 1-dehydrogenase-like Zn-dependent alcohol dehydrogenase